ncbi:uncharacterized protein METZ01_LOCUS445118, partial [marine metagenome]
AKINTSNYGRLSIICNWKLRYRMHYGLSTYNCRRFLNPIL